MMRAALAGLALVVLFLVCGLVVYLLDVDPVRDRQERIDDDEWPGR